MDTRALPCPSDLFDRPCASLIGAVGHHAYFTEVPAARQRIARFCSYLRINGLARFLQRAYPADRGKAFIVNVIGDDAGAAPCLVDGNAHLVSIALSFEGVTLGDIARAAARPGVIRVWRNGWEGGSGQDAAYDTYIPFDTDVRRIPAARAGVDRFVQPARRVQVIPSSIRFDSPFFAPRDRGRPLAETVQALRERGVG